MTMVICQSFISPTKAHFSHDGAWSWGEGSANGFSKKRKNSWQIKRCVFSLCEYRCSGKDFGLMFHWPYCNSYANLSDFDRGVEWVQPAIINSSLIKKTVLTTPGREKTRPTPNILCLSPCMIMQSTYSKDKWHNSRYQLLEHWECEEACSSSSNYKQHEDRGKLNTIRVVGYSNYNFFHLSMHSFFVFI